MPPLVSIVMPVYNGMPHLAATLAAVEAQTHRNLQRIAIDDGSTDGSLDLVASSGLWSVQQTSRLGPNRARNLALSQQVKGDFVVFLDQDDLWHPDHLAECLSTAARRPGASAVMARRQTFGHATELRLGRTLPDVGEFDPWAAFPINLIDSPSMVLIRRDALDRMGGWPADRDLGADGLAWWRLSAAGPLAVSPRRTVGIRHSAASYSSTARRKPARYLEVISRSAQDAVEAIPAEARLAVADDARGLLEATGEILESTLSDADLAPGARRLEEALSGRGMAMLVVTVGFLGWLLRPTLAAAPEAEAMRVLAKLTGEWPVDAGRTRAAILRVAGTAAPDRAAALLRNRPWSSGARTAFLAALLFRLARGLGRVDDPLGLTFGAASWRIMERLTPPLL